MGRSCENVDFCGLLPAPLIQPVMAGVPDPAFLISPPGDSDVGVPFDHPFTGLSWWAVWQLGQRAWNTDVITMPAEVTGHQRWEPGWRHRRNSRKWGEGQGGLGVEEKALQGQCTHFRGVYAFMLGSPHAFDVLSLLC